MGPRLRKHEENSATHTFREGMKNERCFNNNVHFFCLKKYARYIRIEHYCSLIYLKCS